MNTARIFLLSSLFGTAAMVAGQQPAGTAVPFERAADDVQQRLAAALAELARLNETIAAEKVPMGERLGAMEAERAQVRAEHSERTRRVDAMALDLNNLRADLEWRTEQNSWLAERLVEYARSFESRLHVAELARHSPAIAALELATENPDLAATQAHAAQLAVLHAAMSRLEEALGGVRFAGTAVGPDGVVRNGTFVMAGPTATFAATDASVVGTAEQRLGSLEPTIVEFSDPAVAAAGRALIATGRGALPLDPTLGNASKIAALQETWAEHVGKGGPVMVPIFAIGGLAFLAALVKWLSLARQRRPGTASMQALLHAVRARDPAAVVASASAVRGPARPMLVAGAQHLDEPRELIEEVMYETLLTTRLRLQRMLPFIGLTAGAAPLLGLLGTVTGIMSTFNLITVYGTGDVKTLSSGISEALITTEYGLIVAIPSLLLHALLSRKAKSVLDEMEKCAIAFANEVVKSRATTVPQVA